MRPDIELRESLFHTRDLERSARIKKIIVCVEEVVGNMRERSQVSRPRVQPILEEISHTIVSLRAEVESSVYVQEGTFSKSAYADEGQFRIRCSTSLEKQLEGVQEEQTGPLIGQQWQCESRSAVDWSGDDMVISTIIEVVALRQKVHQALQEQMQVCR